jgi:hypothetical protein
MSIQIVNKGVSVLPQSKSSIIPITNTVPIIPTQPDRSAIEQIKLGKDLDSSVKQFLQLKEVRESKQALELLPISTLKIDEMKAVIEEIDIRDPNSLQIITPTNVINYVDHAYGNIDMKILEADALSISEPSGIDVSTLPIDLSRNTSLDFIAFDAGMAFLASNGTSPENLVIAENMAAEGTGFPVLLSLNDNNEQNLQVIQSSDIQSIQLSVDIPLGLDPIEFSDFIVDISNRTETLQLISPDLVTETSYDPQIQMTEFAILTNIKAQPKSSSSKPVSNIKNFFGDLSGEDIRQILDNPQTNPDFVPLSTIDDDGQFFLSIHGEIASSELEEFDCRDFERLGFVGRQGLILGLLRDAVNKFALNIKPKSQRLQGDVCKLPKLLFRPEKDKIQNTMFGLSHIDSDGNIKVVLSNYDLVQIFGNQSATLHSILNLVRIISGGSKNINIDISACLAVSENFKSTGLDNYRIGNTQRDIPRFFQYTPKKLDPIDAPRAHGKAKDSACKFGLEKSQSAQNECADFQSEQEMVQELIDPNDGIISDGISAALNSDLVQNVDVLFEVTYPFKIDPLVPRLSKQMIEIKGIYYRALQHWYDADLLHSELLESDEFIDLGFKPTITISDFLPEINEVFNDFKKGDSISFAIFKSRLLIKLESNRLVINNRVK